MEQITFIIPSIGRLTLKRTLDSLKNQTNPNWKAIVVFDGVDIVESDDTRIQCMRIEKVGFENCAGIVRNAGMKQVTTEWIGFVDDDDIITPNYVSCFLEELKKGHDVIIFRMASRNFNLKKFSSWTKKMDVITFPPVNAKIFKVCEVGISFCMKSALFREGFEFNPSHIEDYTLLNKMRYSSKRILLSNYITYVSNPDLNLIL